MKAFLDSSIFIENFKGNPKAKQIFLEVVEFFDCFINGIVFSEVTYKVLGLKAGVSPLTLKAKKK